MHAPSRSLPTPRPTCPSRPAAARDRGRPADRGTRRPGAGGGHGDLRPLPGDALRERRPVTTSRPSPEMFARAYRAAAEAGADRDRLPAPVGGVLRHVRRRTARRQGGTRAGAGGRHGGRRDGPGLLRPGGGGDAPEAGGTLDEAVAAAEKRAEGTSALFYVDTLDYLRRGGRIGAAQALLGSALAFKPLLDWRTAVSACWRRCGRHPRPSPGLRRSWWSGPVTRPWTSPYTTSPRRAGRAARRAPPRTGSWPAGTHVSEVGAVIGAHTGPGLLGAVRLTQMSERVIHNPPVFHGNSARSTAVGRAAYRRLA